MTASLDDARRIGRAVWTAPGGAVHRHDLAERTGLWDAAVLADALWIAYRRRWVDFCRSFVVRPPAAKDGRG